LTTPLAADQPTLPVHGALREEQIRDSFLARSRWQTVSLAIECWYFWSRSDDMMEAIREPGLSLLP
jgi:hypothetical protein